MTTNNGQAYVRARAASDGRVESTLQDIRWYYLCGDGAMEEQARRSLDELIYARHDGAPMYSPADVTRVVESLRVST